MGLGDFTGNLPTPDNFENNPDEPLGSDLQVTQLDDGDTVRLETGERGEWIEYSGYNPITDALGFD